MLSRDAKWARDLLFVVEIIPVSPVGGERRVSLRFRKLPYWARATSSVHSFKRFTELDVQTMTGAGSRCRKSSAFVVFSGLERSVNGTLRA
jgi:hypothetical protein